MVRITGKALITGPAKTTAPYTERSNRVEVNTLLWILIKKLSRHNIYYRQLYIRTFDEAATALEVSPQHEPIIIARVRWSARQFSADTEMLAPTSNSSLLMAQMEQNAKSARSSYFKLLFNALLAESGESAVIHWKMDKWDQIY